MILTLNILFIAIIILFFFAGPDGRQSAIRGGAIGGLIIGVLIGLFNGDTFFSGKTGFTIGGIVGIIAEILGAMSDRVRKGNKIQ